MTSRLKINTSVTPSVGLSSGKYSAHDRTSPNSNPLMPLNGVTRMRSTSNASTSSTLSIISPKSSSTNASSSSLYLPAPTTGPRSDRKPTPTFDDSVRLGAEYVLAMHDFSPQQQNATCLSFRAGQVIHVLNRDSSGWWDGELEGRRGWFPSNYVSADIDSLTDDEEPPDIDLQERDGHTQTSSTVSTASWASRLGSAGSDVDIYCPPLMIPLLHGLSLLQSAVRANRISHFQPSTACIISCVRSVLSATDCLPRESPILQRFPALSQERKQILTVLASLVAQAKKASEDIGIAVNQEIEVETMLRLGGQVFAHVRRFLAVAVQCGVELPERRRSRGSIGSTDTEGGPWTRMDEDIDSTPVAYVKTKAAQERADHINRQSPTRKDTVTPNATLRAKSMGDLKNQNRHSIGSDSDSAIPLLPNRIFNETAKREQYLRRERSFGAHRNHQVLLSISSTTSSTSSYSSSESLRTPAPTPFPHGPSSSAQVMDALRSTHDHYLSTIAAFIGHAHSHSRTSHASSTGHLYDLVREIVEMVCKLLTIVEAVMRHPDVPPHKLGNLRAAKEGLYNVTSSLAESVRMLTIEFPSTMSEEEEKQLLLRSATGALKAGADCVAAVKICLNRSAGERPFIVQLPTAGDPDIAPFTPSKFVRPLAKLTGTSPIGEQPDAYDEDLTIQAQTLSRDHPSGSEMSSTMIGSTGSEETYRTSLEESKQLPSNADYPVDMSLPSPTSFTPTDEDGTTWEGSTRSHTKSLVDKIYNGNLPSVPLEPMHEFIQDPAAWMLSHDYALDDVAYNSEGHLVGATIDVLVEKMTPHDSIVDPAFSAVFFLTFRLFSSPIELVEVIIARYNLAPPRGLSMEDLQIWHDRKGVPVRLRVSNFIKLWVEMYWRPVVDRPALPALTVFVRDGLSAMFPGTTQRILELLEMRRQTTDVSISPKGDRIRDPGMSINPPSAVAQTSEIPRPTMTKTLLAALRSKNFASISITDFDALELARQLTIMECNLYCAIQPEEVLETGLEGAKLPVNVRAVSSLSTVITGWVAESILNEHDIKRRTVLVKFFIKVADRCTSLHNYSTPRSMLAALDSSTISRLHQTWMGLPQKYKAQLENLRRLADHGRNYHEYRSKLRNTAPPAVPFLGLYLTDVTFCREGNPSLRASPMNPDKKLLNFNKYHKLARIVQDMQRFQVSYNLKAIPEVQEYLNIAFENSKHHGDLQDLYRRSLLVEPKQPADTPPASDVRQLFNWATRSQSQPITS